MSCDEGQCHSRSLVWDFRAGNSLWDLSLAGSLACSVLPIQVAFQTCSFIVLGWVPWKPILRWRIGVRIFISICSQESYLYGSEESRTGQKEKLSCHTAVLESSVIATMSSRAGMGPTESPELCQWGGAFGLWRFYSWQAPIVHMWFLLSTLNSFGVKLAKIIHNYCH